MKSEVFCIEDTVKVSIPGEPVRVGEIVEMVAGLFKVQVGPHEILAFEDEMERCETENHLEMA